MAQGFSVNIKAGSTIEESTIFVSGKEVHIIKDEERKSFGIESDDELKSAIERCFGKRPNDAFLHRPIPYSVGGWDDVDVVQTVLVPKSWKVLEITSKPLILAKELFDNTRSSHQATFTADLSAEVKDSVSTTWSNSKSISVGQTISYGVELDFLNIGGETSINFEATWGESTTKTKEITLRTSSGVSVTLGPHESAEAELVCSKGIMKIQVVYEATLGRFVLAHYDPPYKNVKFWTLWISTVLGDANKAEIVEDIEIGFYSSATVTVRDPQGKLMTQNVWAAKPIKLDSE